MTAQVLNGNAIAAGIRRRIAGRVQEREAAGLRPPGLAVLVVGDDPASEK
ncbi:MAG: bifunctional methylenetetrahydrofolate dehydrogenase/methenyltetrahydrofolate cyclohydrolase, partial [Gammaproteobacteria bacterium]|nr:bifunctional methylenetetrahydrofolate dehydrogenase/methenyltetrahydrofolate cyclohydrolase [Gammaproteobacteria bacterium]